MADRLGYREAAPPVTFGPLLERPGAMCGAARRVRKGSRFNFVRSGLERIEASWPGIGPSGLAVVSRSIEGRRRSPAVPSMASKSQMRGRLS